MRKIVAMCLGFLATLYAVNWWAGTLTPRIERQERLVLNDTFYEQNTELKQTIQSVAQEKGPKIITIGDSTMYGAIVYPNETTPYYLRGLLQQQNINADVCNLAFPGARPADLYAVMKMAASARPNLMIVDVNPVFFSQRILQEGALADKNLKREFLLERDVPQGIFTDNRVEEIVKTALKETNIGQNQAAINKTLFGNSEPRQYIRDWVKKITPPAPPTPPVPAEPSIIGVSWHQKKWDAKEQATMARIYTQGPLNEQNDSVKMLRAMIHYAKDQHIPVLFYLAPQNEELIGRFFSLPQLHQNEDYLLNILRQEGCWALDLRNAIPEYQFGDYDHMLKGGNEQVARLLAAEIAKRGVLQR